MSVQRSELVERIVVPAVGVDVVVADMLPVVLDAAVVVVAAVAGDDDGVGVVA